MEIRSMPWIASDNFLSDIFPRLFTIDFQQACFFSVVAEDGCGFLLVNLKPFEYRCPAIVLTNREC